MSNKKKVIVMGSFKTGTSSISNLINKAQNDIELIKGKHNRSLKNQDFDLIIIPVRKHFEIFQSAFFQDITKPSYKYFFNEDKDIILKENVSNLINHFLNINWLDFSHLSPNTSILHLKNIIKDYKLMKLNDELYYLNEFTNKYTNKKFKVMIIGFCYLPIEKVENIFKTVNINISEKFFHANNGNRKWYAKKYIEFKDKLKEHPNYNDYLNNCEKIDYLF
jgi:hypothetical protein